MKNTINITKYIKAIGIILIAVVLSVALPNITKADELWADDSWSNTDDGVWADDSWSNSNDGVWADDSWANTNDGVWADDSWSNTDDGVWADDSWDGGYDYVETVTDYYDYGYSYYPRSSYPIGGRSNWVGVGLVGSPVGWQPVTPVTPTPPGNIVTPVYSVPSVVYTQPTYTQPVVVTQYVPNQVLAYQDTNPSLDSVYLSDVPYTGLSDYYGLIIFISILLSWSAILAYVFLKRKISEKISFANVYANITSDNKNDSINSEFVNQIISDKADIREVEEYARMKKVLLSTDASAKLIKLQRLGEGNAKSIIDSLSTKEWITIGEKELIF